MAGRTRPTRPRRSRSAGALSTALSTALASALVALLVTGPAAPARAAYSPAVPLSADQVDAQDVTLDIDLAGNATVVWLRRASAPPTYQVLLRRRTAAGVLGPVQLIAVGAGSPIVAVDDDGDAWVFWPRPDRLGGIQLLARQAFRTGTLGPPVALSPAGLTTFGALADVSPGGDAVVTWTQRQPDGTIVPMVRRLPAAGTAGPARRLAASPFQPTVEAVHVGRDGAALLIWSDTARLFGRRLDPAGVLGAAQVLYSAPSPNDTVGRASVSVSAAGLALVTWGRWDSAALTGSGLGRTVSPGLVLGPVLRLTPVGQDADGVTSAAAPGGARLISWGAPRGGWVRRLSATGVLGPAVNLGERAVVGMALTATGAGTVVLGGSSADRLTRSLWSATVTPTGFGRPVEVQRNVDFPRVRTTTGGRVTVAFQRTGPAWTRAWALTGP